jgi:hypothetical protein
VVIIHPGDPKGDLPLRLNDALQDVLLFVSRMCLQQRVQGLQDFLYRLMKLGLTGEAFL